MGAPGAGSSPGRALVATPRGSRSYRQPGRNANKEDDKRKAAMERLRYERSAGSRLRLRVALGKTTTYSMRDLPSSLSVFPPKGLLFLHINNPLPDVGDVESSMFQVLCNYCRNSWYIHMGKKIYDMLYMQDAPVETTTTPFRHSSIAECLADFLHPPLACVLMFIGTKAAIYRLVTSIPVILASYFFSGKLYCLCDVQLHDLIDRAQSNMILLAYQ